jgi:exodeoxyribonuclease V alpha subunit
VSQNISGQVSRVTFENEQSGFRVVRVEVEGRGVVTAVGNFQFVAPGTNVRMTGDFTRDPRHGDQFRVHTMVTVEPTTLDGIEKYLGSGLIPGVGPGFARRIVSTFGLQTLSVLDEHPERLSEVRGLGPLRRKEIREYWKEQRGLGQLMLLLQTHGVSGQLARRIMERYGERSAEIVQTSPYRLAMEVRGIGFKTADRIADSMGISRDHPERAEAGVHHLLNLARERGHVLLPREELVIGASELLGIDAAFVHAAIDSSWAAGRIVVQGEDVYLTALHRAEVGLLAELERVLEFGAPALDPRGAAVREFEKRIGLELAQQQRQAIEAVAANKVVVITGGPGVGKTTIVKVVLDVFKAAKLATRLAAPTGRAAKRLAEATGAPSVTVHRLLEFEPKLRRFQRGRGNPIDAQAIIVDEASMIDVLLAEALFAAVPDPARVVVVGDADQLPSVGPGSVLGDMIESGRVCVVRLNEVFRQGGDSLIIQNAHRILAGNPPRSPAAVESNADFFVIERSDPEHAAATVEELVARRIPQRFGFDAQRDIQVLTPMHKGASGTIALNERLQRTLNPGEGGGLTRSGQQFRPGDKVMQLRNDYDKEVFNGDLGYVSRVDSAERRLEVSFDGRLVPFGEAELEDLVLAYATSIHKSQGSEYPAIVVPFLSAHFPMLSRNLLYTAVTRARKLCVLVADPKAIRLALSETRKEERFTRLARRLASGNV